MFVSPQFNHIYPNDLAHSLAHNAVPVRHGDRTDAARHSAQVGRRPHPGRRPPQKTVRADSGPGLDLSPDQRPRAGSCSSAEFPVLIPPPSLVHDSISPGLTRATSDDSIGPARGLGLDASCNRGRRQRELGLSRAFRSAVLHDPMPLQLSPTWDCTYRRRGRHGFGSCVRSEPCVVAVCE